MATPVLLRRSSVAGRIPTTADMTPGELAINTADGKLFLRSVSSVLELGTQGPKGDPGTPGTAGSPGAVFTPSVDATGILSWTNNGGLTNPTAVNIKGPKGDTGSQGLKGDTGLQGPKGDTGLQGPKGDTGPAGPAYGYLDSWSRVDPATKVGMYDPGTSDANTWLTGGMYRMNENANIPSGTLYGQMLVIRGAQDTVAQMAFDYDVPEFYVRAGNPPGLGGGAWTSWARAWTSYNFDAMATARLNGNGISWVASTPSGSPMYANNRSIGFANSGTSDRWAAVGAFHSAGDHITGGGGYTSVLSSWVHMPNTRYAQSHWGWRDDGFELALIETGTYKGGLKLRFDSVLYYDGQFQASVVRSVSDVRKKRNLVKIENALDKIDHITGFTYELIDSNMPSAGLISQDVEKILPEAVSTDPDDTKHLDYNATLALLVNAVKELKQEVREMREQFK